jgi:hypothetical protein
MGTDGTRALASDFGLAVPLPVQGQPGRVQYWPKARNRARLALDARERDLREGHPSQPAFVNSHTEPQLGMLN